MKAKELDDWFATNKERLESSYLVAEEPWRQSGFSGPAARWEACRRPIADCVTESGTYLDVGCANGYLLECLLKWTAERDTQLDPYGLDISEKLVALAKQRLPELAEHLYIGNAWTWHPPRQFDYVGALLDCVPDELRSRFARRLLDEFVSPGGLLILPEYHSRRDPPPETPIDDFLTSEGFTVQSVKSGFWEGKELTRLAVLATD